MSGEAAVGPAEIRLLVFALVAALVLGIAAFALLRLWDMLRQERRRSRQESLASVAALLRAPEKATRLNALNLLTSFPLVELSTIEAPLWELMKDPDPEVRAAAGRLMALLHPPAQLLRQLAGRQAAEKLQAIEGLAAVGGQKALAALLEAAGRASEEPVRQAAKAALARGESPEAFSFLILSLGSADPILRAAAKDVFKTYGLRALSPLLSALRDPRKALRTTAVELIGELGLQEGAEALVSLLSDPVDEVRAQAARALGRLSQAGSGTMAALQKALSDSSSLVQEEAAHALALRGDEASLVPLLEFLRRRLPRSAARPRPEAIQFISRNFPSDPAALSAWKSLFDAADETFLSVLAKAIEQSAEGVRQEWIERLPSLEGETKEMVRSLLIRLGKAGLREPFRAQVYDRSPRKASARAEVARLLGEIGTADFGEEIFALLSDPDSTVRREAAWSAGRIAHFATVDGLCQALSDPDAEVRTEAARSLTHLIEQAQGGTGLPQELTRQLVDQAGTGLLQAVNDPVNSVRAEVARALGLSRISSAIPSLVAWALGDENQQVREAAAEALVHMPPADAIPLLAEALSYKETSVRERAAEILGAVGDPGAVSHLIRSLQDESSQVRETAARSLWEIGSAGHGDALLVHLQSPDPKIRASIAGLLGKVKAEEALDGLAHLLRDPNEFVRAAVVNALARFGPIARRHLPALIERLEDPDAFVRSRAVKAIFALGQGEPQASQALAQAVKDEDPMVFSEAVGAMVELAAGGVLEPLAGVLLEPKARAAASELLANAEPATLRRLLAALREAKGEAQAGLLGLLTEAMKSLASIGGYDYKQDLASVDPGVRLAALEALSLFGTEGAAEAVAEVLRNDPVAEIRRRSAVILGRMPGAAAQEALHRAAQQDLDPEVREAARGHLRLSA